MVRFPPGRSQLVISDNKQLLFPKLEQRNGVWRVTSQRSVEVSDAPLGLSVSGDQLLVCDACHIHVLSTSGEETHIVKMPQGVKATKAMAQLTSPGFVVMDTANAQIVMVTENREIQHTYRCRWFTSGDIVCHDHSIYVADSNNDHVDELSDDGRHVRQLISQQGMWWQ